MHTWTAQDSSKWNLSINVGSLRKVKADTDVDLLEFATGKQSTIDQVSDVFTLAAILWSLSEKQADERKVTPDQFAELLNGEAVEGATKALLDDLVEFFPEKKRQALQKMLDKAGVLEDEIMDEVLVKLETMDLRKELEASLAQEKSEPTFTKLRE